MAQVVCLARLFAIAVDQDVSGDIPTLKSSTLCSTRIAGYLTYVRAFEEISHLMARARARDPSELETRFPWAIPNFVAAARPRRNGRC